MQRHRSVEGGARAPEEEPRSPQHTEPNQRSPGDRSTPSQTGFRRFGDVAGDQTCGLIESSDHLKFSSAHFNAVVIWLIDGER